jgi:hypothetical protein
MVNKKILRTFGFIWALIFFLVSYSYNMNVIFLLISLVFFFSAVLYPNIYTKIYLFQMWIKFGNLMGKVNSKIIILILFFFIFTPIGIFLRLIKKDLLNKKLEEKKKSYFIARKIQAGSMKDQF